MIPGFPTLALLVAYIHVWHYMVVIIVTEAIQRIRSRYDLCQHKDSK